MTKQVSYNITGMTCGSCVARVKSSLEQIEGVQYAEIALDANQGLLTLSKAVAVSKLQEALSHAGNYSISLNQKHADETAADTETKSSFFATYKPLFLIVLFIAGVSALAQYPTFDWLLWMRYFMAGFFIVFSFFKLLNLKGFANSYRMYDVVAARWTFWAYLYPFVELALGIAYLVHWQETVVHISTIVVLGVSSIGVIQSNLNKRKIKCACLGDVFNLPMSTVTVVEDLTMVAMATFMLAI